MNEYLFSAVLIAGGFLAGWLFYFPVMILLKRWGRAVSLKGFKADLGGLKAPLRYLFPLTGISIVFPLLRLPEKIRLSADHYMNVLFIALFGWVGVKIVYIVRDAILCCYDISARDNAFARSMHTQIRLMANIVGVAVILLTSGIILMTFPGIKHIGVSILASAGIAGIVLGFAAQKTLGNFIAGIQLAIAQPIRLDDVVVIEGEWGWIEEITLTFVVVRIWDLRRLVLPISYFLEKPFQNWTRASADLLGTVFIYADYTVPVGQLRDELTRILRKSPRWDKRANVLQVTNMTEKTVELRALMSSADSPTLWDLRCEVREGMLKFLQESFPGSLPKTRIAMDKE
ncbi:MAG: mechanosensitive ion channel [Candidatus Omnitrophica bacterium]|nr:mechanosensitive ion channel [Candidatus Omnitrophota bacterium]